MLKPSDSQIVGQEPEGPDSQGNGQAHNPPMKMPYRFIPDNLDITTRLIAIAFRPACT